MHIDIDIAKASIIHLIDNAVSLCGSNIVHRMLKLRVPIRTSACDKAKVNRLYRELYTLHLFFTLARLSDELEFVVKSHRPDV